MFNLDYCLFNCRAEVKRPVPPLKNLDFFIYGLSPKDKEALKIRILKMGGNVPTKSSKTLAAVVSTAKEIAKMNFKLKEFKEDDIQVIEPTFFDDIKDNGSVADTLEMIRTKNIADWGSDVSKKRILLRC